MTLATELLGAPDLAAVRRIVQSSEPVALRDAVEPLAAEVLRLMRTDARTALDVADRVAIAADAVGDTRLRARADWVRAHGLSGVLRNREAADAYARAAAAYREVGDRVGEAKVAIGWINALMYLGEYPKAVTIGSRARDVLRRHHLHPEAARLSMNLGNVHHRLERQSEALREYDRALRAARKLADPVMLRVIQFNRANVLTNLGRLQKAEELYGMVRNEALAAGETRTAGFAEYSLGNLELLRGEYGRAYHRLETARTVFEDLDDAHYLTLALTDLAELLLEINGFARAKALAHRAQGTAEQHGMRLEAARSALLEGIACVELGEWERAQAGFESARASFRREGNHVAQALCSLYVAELDRRRGRRARATHRLREAAAVFAAEGLPLRHASAQLRLAGVELERGRTRDARRAAASVRRALRRVRSPWLKAQLDHLSGRIALKERRLNAAIRSFRTAVRGIEVLRGRIGIDEFRVSFAEDKAPIYADLVHAVLRRGGKGAVAEAFEVAERSRSRALVDLLAGRLEAASARADPSAGRLVARLETLRAELNWLSGFGPDPSEGRDERRLARSAPERHRCEAEIADTVNRLRAEDGALGALTAGETTTIAETRQWLGEATLVEYYVTRRDTLAFVVTADEERVVSLDSTQAAAVELMTKLRFHIEKWAWGAEYVRARERTLLAALEGELRSLAERLWDPLGVESRRVVLVPHGPLHSLPFHALIGADGRPLFERHVISRLPSASVRPYLERRRGDGGRRPPRVLAVGVGEPSVPRVEEEARLVRRLWPRGRILCGPRATRRRFLDAADGADVVHVATHGMFRGDDPHFSALRLADGWMSLYDLYGMRLDAELVCLSACQSGRSWVGAGDEIVGLARGFLHAGARSVLVSLWPVQDDSTARLMSSFHGRLRAGESAEEALPGAMRELREERPHPYHWAPFVLIGAGGAVGASRWRSSPRSGTLDRAPGERGAGPA